jgi:enoyl-CoA hydratase/carnithine racemase
MPNESLPLLTEQIGPVRMLTLNRPDRLNAFTPAVLHALNAALDAAARDNEARVVVVTGSGARAFAAGNDVEGLAALDAVGAYRNMTAGQKTFLRLHEFAKPTIAMVNGYALGGGFELALACDFVIASHSASFGFPEITLNTMPGWGGTQFAVLKLGVARARQMVLTGRRVSAGECAAFGFIEQIVAPERLRETTLAFAGELASRDGFALEMAKRALNSACDLPLGAGLDFEAAHYAVNFTGAAARAGLQDFLDRRAARHATAGAASLPAGTTVTQRG